MTIELIKEWVRNNAYEQLEHMEKNCSDVSLLFWIQWGKAVCLHQAKPQSIEKLRIAHYIYTELLKQEHKLPADLALFVRLNHEHCLSAGCPGTSSTIIPLDL